jgi:hypothetical protein
MLIRPDSKAQFWRTIQLAAVDMRVRSVALVVVI